MKTLIFLFILIAAAATAQEYTDLFPDTRAPYRFRIYEKEVLQAKEILRIDTYFVDKYMNMVWVQGMLKYEGDTTNLIFVGMTRDATHSSPEVRKIEYPSYIRKDTVYVVPTLEGFENWKKLKGYK